MTIPIPRRPSGVLLGHRAAEITIDAFVDIQCPHSRQIWPTLLNVTNHYKKTDMSLGLFALADGDANKFYDFATVLFEKQAEFYNEPFMHKTHNDLRQLIADKAENDFDINRTKFLERMNDHDIYILARTPIRYAATKSVWATPTIFINNGSNVPVNHSSTLSDWQEVIDPLLK